MALLSLDERASACADDVPMIFRHPACLYTKTPHASSQGPPEVSEVTVTTTLLDAGAPRSSLVAASL